MGAWHTFLHPQRVTRELVRLEETAGALTTERDSLREKLDACRAECERLHGALSQAEHDKHSLTGSLRGLEKQCAADRLHYEEQEAKIAEIERHFASVKDIVARYESRIAHLKDKLAKTRSALTRARNEAQEELTPMRPQQLRKQSKPKAPEQPQIEPARPDEADWYTSPPEL